MADISSRGGQRSKVQRPATARPHWRPPAEAQALLDGFSPNIALLDGRGIIRAVNAAWRDFARANGLERDYVDESYLKVCDRASGPWSDEAPAAAAGIRAVIKGRVRLFALEYPCHAPAARRWYLMRVTALEGLDPLRVAVAHDDITHRRLAEESLHRTSQRLAVVREEERRHLARELHDNIGQRLFALSMVLENILAEPRIAAVPLLGRQLGKLSRDCGELIGDLRDFNQALYPQTLESVGLVAALQQLVRACRRHMPITLRCSKSLELTRVAPPVEIALFRIAQEAISNALRHSRASRVDVELKRIRSLVRLSVVDNGVGFRPVQVEHGLGLKTMEERAKSVGARLELTSRPGKTEVTVRLRL